MEKVENWPPQVLRSAFSPHRGSSSMYQQLWFLIGVLIMFRDHRAHHVLHKRAPLRKIEWYESSVELDGTHTSFSAASNILSSGLIDLEVGKCPPSETS